MEFYRISEPIVRASFELRAAQGCKKNEDCFWVSLLTLGTPLSHDQAYADWSGAYGAMV